MSVIKIYQKPTCMSRTFFKKYNKLETGDFMLKEERIKKGYTQEKLAEMTGIDPRTILRIEKNLTTPKIDTYAKIVIALDMSNEEIGEHIKKLALINKKEQ